MEAHFHQRDDTKILQYLKKMRNILEIVSSYVP